MWQKNGELGPVQSHPAFVCSGGKSEGSRAWTNYKMHLDAEAHKKHMHSRKRCNFRNIRDERKTLLNKTFFIAIASCPSECVVEYGRIFFWVSVRVCVFVAQNKFGIEKVTF